METNVQTPLRAIESRSRALPAEMIETKVREEAADEETSDVHSDSYLRFGRIVETRDLRI